MSTARVLGGTFYPEFTKAKSFGPDLRACIESTVRKLLTTATSSDRPGMLLGKIQSGKTKTFMGVIALAFDNNFDVCVVLTKGPKALAKQTFERVDQEFGDFVNRNDLLVYDIMALPNLSSWEQKRKLVLVVKKQSDNLERLRVTLIESYPDLGHKRVLLIDDEADFASIGYSRSSSEGMQMRTIAKQINLKAGLGFLTQRRKGAEEAELRSHCGPENVHPLGEPLEPRTLPHSSALSASLRLCVFHPIAVFRINDLRQALPAVSFLEVTATPYSLYLQPEEVTIKRYRLPARAPGVHGAGAGASRLRRRRCLFPRG